MPKKILQKESTMLRKVAQSIPPETIKTVRIQKIIKEMMVALTSQDDGVAIAAPQIGHLIRLFIISDKLVDISKEKNINPKPVRENVFINPIIKKLSKEKSTVEEGCLSVRYLYGKVERSIKATIEAYDENGRKFIRGASGLLAQIFQHEVDHLNGILFIDKAKYVESIPPASPNQAKLNFRVEKHESRKN